MLPGENNQGYRKPERGVSEGREAITFNVISKETEIFNDFLEFFFSFFFFMENDTLENSVVGKSN